ncbi:hypothetical protein U1Q18_013217, partial [Sarracenia purpurea var. burkii]
RKREDKVSECLDVRWRVLSGKITSSETRLLLSKSVAIFHGIQRGEDLKSDSFSDIDVRKEIFEKNPTDSSK